MNLCENCIHRNVCSTIEYCNNAEEYANEYGCDEFLDIKRILIPPFMPMDFAYYIAKNTIYWFQVDEIRWDGEDWIVEDYDNSCRFLAGELYHSKEEAEKALEV